MLWSVAGLDETARLLLCLTTSIVLLMPIKFKCPTCGKWMQTPDSAAGKKAKCPQCATMLKVPSNPAAAGGGVAVQPGPAKIDFACSSCGQPIRTPSSAAGKQAKCPHCSSVVPVPTRSTIKPAPTRPAQPPAPQQDPFAGIPSVQPVAPVSTPRARPASQQRSNPFPANPYATPSAGRPRGKASTVSSRVKPPGICLLVLTSLWLVLGTLGAARDVFDLALGGGALQEEAARAGASLAAVLIIRVAVYLIFFGIYGLMAYGAYSMMTLQNRGLAITACVLALIPCLCSPGLVLGMPFGLWGLIVLNKQEVAKAFR